MSIEIDINVTDVRTKEDLELTLKDIIQQILNQAKQDGLITNQEGHAILAKVLTPHAQPTSRNGDEA